MKINPYKKEFDYSYTLGVFPTIELLLHKPKLAQSIYYDEKAQYKKGFEELQELCKKNNIELIKDNYLVERLAQKGNTHVIGSFLKYETTLVEHDNHIVLYQPSDIGNVGMIIRSALGFGAPNIAIISPAIDIYNPQLIRATMGAFFQVNIQYFNSIEEYLAEHKNKVYLFDIKGAQDLREVKLEKPFSLMFGSEGDGLPDEALTLGEVVKIKHSKQIESLNLANSVSIALFYASLE